MKRSFVAALVIAGALPVSAFADQCAWMTGEQAREAVHFAEKGLKYVDYCEPCGDTLGKVRVKTIGSVTSRAAADGAHDEIVIDGEAKDIAYVFVESVAGSNEFENLAALSNCKTDGVSEKITVTAKPTVKGAKKLPPKKAP